jgi:uncharacterized protein YutE (UPF0331/DUF86 family)
MYYVDRDQIDMRLAFIPTLTEACGQLAEAWNESADKDKLLLHLAQERTLHLAIETVTDIGSLLIDAFMMRDASSYEDIVEILEGEGVFGEETAAVLKELVALRRPLVQDYTSYSRESLHPLLNRLTPALQELAGAVPAFIQREMV